jgi:hypothetical protein
MKKMLFFLLFATSMAYAFTPTDDAIADCNCPAVTSVQKTRGGSGTAGWSWLGVSGATEYELWYYRHADGFTSSTSVVTATNAVFTGLAGGEYTFYFRTVCGSEGSSFIGIHDIVEN